MFIETISEAEAQGKLREVFEGDQKASALWPTRQGLQSAPRRAGGLARLSGKYPQEPAAATLRTGHAGGRGGFELPDCLLAHGAILNENGVSVDQLRAILTDFHDAGLEPAEVAMMDFAQKIARSANEMTQADVDALRALSAYHNDSGASSSVRQMRLQPMARKASWMSARRS